MSADDMQDSTAAPTIGSLVMPSLDHPPEGEPHKISENAAVEAIQELSLSVESPSAADLNGTAMREFDPQPIVMSRGDTSSSIESMEELNNNNNGNHRSTKLKSHPLQENNRFLTPNSSHDSNDQGQIILTANHQQRLSTRNLGKLDTSLPSNNNATQPKKKKERSRSNSPAPGAAKSMIAGAWGWIQKQKEKQNQRHLKELAEQQVQKLKEAQNSDPNVKFTVVVDDESDHARGCFEPKPQHTSDSYEEESDTTTNDPQQQQQQQSAQDEDDISWIPPVRWVEEQVKKTGVPPSPRSSLNNGITPPDPNKPIPFLLTAEQMHDIAKHVLPKGIAFCRWKRLYSLTRDGDSFFQCLRLCGTEPKSLMVLKTTRGAIFGGYADAPWEQVYSHQTGSFHGSAQACLFSFAIPPNDKDTSLSSTTNIRVFHWTGANRYIQYTDTSESRRMLAFGGGGREGAFGLCVESDFQTGSTGPCDTFGNLPLCDQENFHILDLEIWGFLTGQF